MDRVKYQLKFIKNGGNQLRVRKMVENSEFETVPIAEAGLDVRSTKLLEQCGVRTVGQFSKLAENELADIVGREPARNILRLLRRAGVYRTRCAHAQLGRCQES